MNNHKKNVFLYSLIIIILLIPACENPIINLVMQPKTITFETNGGTNIENQSLFKGEKITRPSEPDKTNSRFIGWYQDNDTFLDIWDFDTIPPGDMTLYAKWELIGIALDPPGDVDFGFVFMGYSGIEARLITINNLAPHPTGEIEIVLSGSNKDDFILSTNMISDIGMGGSATFTLVPVTGLGVGTFTATVTITGDNEINASFNVTLIIGRAITSIAILNQPSNLTYTSGQPLNLSGLTLHVLYSDDSMDTNVPHTSFASIGIQTTPAHGETISVIDFNNKPIEIKAGFISIQTNNLTVNPAPITSVVFNVIAPIMGQTPQAPVSVAGNFTFNSSWSPDHMTFTEDHYTLSITLTVTSNNFTFTGGLTTATINGFAATVTDNTGSTVTLSYEFETGAKYVTDIEIITQPRLTYDHGDLLNLSELVVRFRYNDNSSGDNVSFSQFTANHLTTSLANGIPLLRSSHNSTPITVTYSGIPVTRNTNVLTINQREITITGVTAQNRQYDAATTVTLSGGTLNGVLAADSANVNFTLNQGTMTDSNVGNGKQVGTSISLTGTGAANYRLTQPTVTVNITPASLTIASAFTTKPFDGTNTIVDGISVEFNGILPDDFDLVWTGSITATYTGTTVPTTNINIQNITLTGSRAAQYTIITPINNFSVIGGGITTASGWLVDPPSWETVNVIHNQITLNVVPNPNQWQSVEYAISRLPNPTNLTWQDGRTFTVDTQDTFYLFARSKAQGNNFSAGPISESLSPITSHRVILNANEAPHPYQIVFNGAHARVPPTPINTGYYLDGWSLNNNEWNFASNTVTSNITLNANWISNPEITISFSGGNLTASSNNITIHFEVGIKQPTAVTLRLENPSEYESMLWQIQGSNFGFLGMDSLLLDSSFPIFRNNFGQPIPGPRTIVLTVKRQGETEERSININFNIN
ncbi:MAG: YDG domain-containing protein [Treponema sp.]|jgi:uncharacterized repeat protein (TIGR02543 family)|nr:YDG domain-containing protein [Treponema sp.]